MDEFRKCVLSKSLTLLCLRSLQSSNARNIFCLAVVCPPPHPFHPWRSLPRTPTPPKTSAVLVICGDPATGLLHLMYRVHGSLEMLKMMIIAKSDQCTHHISPARTKFILPCWIPMPNKQLYMMNPSTNGLLGSNPI